MKNQFKLLSDRCREMVYELYDEPMKDVIVGTSDNTEDARKIMVI